VLAYIVADDERKPLLNPFASDELAAIKQAAIDEDIALAAHVDFTGPGIASRRCFIAGANGEDRSACRNSLEENSATMFSLQEFLVFARNHAAPDSRVAVFFWGHGAGPAGFFLDPNPEPPKSLALPDVTAAFQAIELPIEVMLFRDCWTASLEMAYEFDGVTRYAIASQGLVPIPGAWPFKELFQVLNAMPDPAQAIDMARLLVPLDTHYQRRSNRGVPPLSEVRFAALRIENGRARLKTALGAFVEELGNLTGGARLSSRSVLELAKGGDAALVDVITMCEGLRDLPDPMGKAARDLQAATAELRISQTDGTPAAILDGSLRGISLFRRPAVSQSDSIFIESVVYDVYSQLVLCNETGWNTIAYETLLD